jgi:4-hydroxy-tetrahydrodipicolinate reductase
MQVNVCLAGITGWVGAPLAAAITASSDLTLVAAVARRAAGTTVANVKVSGSIEEALATPSDVFVDYTSADVVKANVLLAIAAGRHVVVGSSGLSDADFDELDRAARARSVGVIAVGNFAIAAALLQRFAAEAASHFPTWEIVDYAHDSKPDAPSGTARELAWKLSQTGKTSQPEVPIAATLGSVDTRGTLISGQRIHSIRLSGYTIGLEVHFGRNDERLSIRYEGGTGAEPYIAGTLLAIRRVASVTGVVRGLDSLL